VGKLSGAARGHLMRGFTRSLGEEQHGRRGGEHGGNDYCDKDERAAGLHERERRVRAS
jgi:hypothetical protein